MKLDRRGFYRPSLNVELCNTCGLCWKACPVTLSSDSLLKVACKLKPIVYAAWSNDETVHVSSSSGGVFSELARAFIEIGGLVCGCEWGAGLVPRHVVASSWSDVGRLRGSKYIPSFVREGLYSELIDQAKLGIPVLFCGTPCQVAGFASIIPPKVRDKILLVDLVCHGVPSLKSFQRYLDWKFGGPDHIDSFTFRNKDISTQTICVTRRDGSRYLCACGNDSWFRSAMVYHLLLQRSCFTCKFGSIPRCGDITLGDFWGIPEALHDQRGDSVVLLNSAEGERLFAGILAAGRLRAVASDYDTISRKVGRLRGRIYVQPRLHWFAMRWVEFGWSFVFFDLILYRPLRLTERLSGFIRRRSGPV